MKIFHCTHCQQVVFFENTECIKCGHRLAYLTDRGTVSAIKPAQNSLWTFDGPGETTRLYRLCEHSTGAVLCNWALPAEDPNAQCQSCRLTTVIPDLGIAGHPEAWRKLEAAKRRLIYTILDLGLPCDGLSFEFKANIPGDAAVLTGHHDGV